MSLLGVIIGVVLVGPLAALLGVASAQDPALMPAIGLCRGLGIGSMQALVLSSRIQNAWRWAAATAVAMLLLGFVKPWAYSNHHLIILLLASGSVAIFQAPLLRGRLHSPLRWCVVAFAAYGLGPWLNDQLSLLALLRPDGSLVSAAPGKLLETAVSSAVTGASLLHMSRSWSFPSGGAPAALEPDRPS